MQFKLLIAAVVGLAAIASAATAAGPRIGQIKTASGQTVIMRDGARLPAKPGDAVYTKDVIQTGENGSLGISFIDNSVFSTGPNSEIALEQFRFSNATGGAMLANITRGTLSVVSGDITKKSPGALKIKTPSAILAVRGTTFAVEIAGDRR